MTRTLLMVHGIGCGADAWDAMRPHFKTAGWDCHAPTLFPEKRTVASPPADLPELRFQEYVDAMSVKAAELAAPTGQKPAIIGHSMGGLIAQVLAERGDVSAAIFLTPAQPADCIMIAPSMVWTFANVFSRGTQRGRKFPQKVWRHGFRWGVLNKVAKIRHDEIYAHARYDSGRVYGDISDGIEIDETKISIPTLTIGARHDRATVVKAVRKVANKYANSPVPGDYQEYEDHAHWIVDEPGTDKVVADITAWLSKKLPA